MSGAPQELKAKEQVASLKLEISGLTKLLEQGAAVGLAEEADLEELIRLKEEAAAERDAQVEQIVALRGEVSEGMASWGALACKGLAMGGGCGCGCGWQLRLAAVGDARRRRRQ